VLDVSSTNKGILLPRLADTTNVASPTAGLFIYNQKTNTPNFYNGTKWQNLNSINSVTGLDSITYTVTSNSGFFTTGTFNAVSISHSGNSPTGGIPIMSTLTFTKNFDINSIPFKKAFASQTVSQTIEFFVYNPGSSTPYYSVKLKNWRISIASFDVSSMNGSLTESYQLECLNIGFKDWVNNNSFGFNVQTGQIVAY
jgi:hypothetical protein